MIYNLFMIPILLIHESIDEREQYIQKMLNDININQNHPDLLWFGADEKLGMEQTKKIKGFLKLKPYQAKGQVIVIVTAEKLTTDAQNSLLKTLEEHAEEVNLFLGAANEDQLLPTLISRCKVIDLPVTSSTITSTSDLASRQAGVEQKYQNDIEKLINSTIEQRFQFIEKLKEKEEFLFSLIIYFRHKLLEKRQVVFLKDLILAEKWAKQNVNIRAVLEYLMLKLPK